MTIGEALRAARGSAGLSQAEAARRAGMSRQRLCDIEAGRRADPSWSTVVAIWGALPDTDLNQVARATLEKNEEARKFRDGGGRYTFSDMDQVCVCGHRLGVHAGAGPRDCLNEIGVMAQIEADQ